MINHARTLLANLDAGDPTGFAEEFIEPTFRPVRLPHAAAQARRMLMGPTPDRHMINYRCRQLMQIVHWTTLAYLVTALDPRITYFYSSDAAGDLVNPDHYLPTINPAGAVTVIGQAEPPDKTGLMWNLFELERLDADLVSVARLSPPTSTVHANYTLSGGGSAPISLPGSGYSFRVLSGTPMVAPVSVEVLNQPSGEIGGLVAAFARLGDASALDLFRLGKGHPYDQLYLVWQREKETPLRTAALVLALIYRTEEARKGG